MKFSSKLALVAVSSLMSVSAFAITDMSTIVDGADLDALSIAELKNPGTTAGDASVAVINQKESNTMAQILQDGDKNFAVIVQAQAGGAAMILQSGTAGGSIAYIYQK